ncbi:MAG: hypothetical protein SNJ71_03625, partial [Bacteroidales bacterium]
MSGRYDLTQEVGTFIDLLSGYCDEDVHYCMPSKYVPYLEDNSIIEKIQAMKIILAVGKEDCFLENNIHLNKSLWEKNIKSELYIWEREAHKPKYWQQMVQIYL